MPKILLYFTLLVSILFSSNCYSQYWTWVNGSNSLNPLPNFGTQGISNSTNSPGGRGYASSCFDATTGTFWLFGGWSTPVTNSNASYYSQDLWKYEIATNQWTWMKGPTTVNTGATFGTKGISSPSNYPGSRISGVMWVDGSGDLWLFGGFGYLSNSLGSLNDLWKYTIATNEWTWMKGSSSYDSPGNYGLQSVPSASNEPPARHAAKGFKDPQGNICLFGGIAQYSSGSFSLNDMWKFNILNNEWTWINGSSSPNQPSFCGTQGTASLNNSPGARAMPTLWQENNSNIWMFGGIGLSSNLYGYLNDLWKYDWTSNMWTWMKGNDSLVNQPGIYGTKGILSNSNLPGARWGCGAWTDNFGDLWLFGGVAYISTSASTSDLSDLWKYDISTNSFVWKKGDTTAWSGGNFGTQGVASSSNFPSAREAPRYWKDINGNFWLFGGQGVGQAPSSLGLGQIGDIWMLPYCDPALIPIAASSNSICEGSALILSANGANTYTWSNSQNTFSTVVWPSSNSIFSLTGDDSLGCSYNSTIAVVVSPNLLAVSGTRDNICKGESDVLYASGCISYNWNTSSISPSITVTPTLNTTYQVSGLDPSGCTFSRSYLVTVSECTYLENLKDSKKLFSLFPNPNNGEFYIETEITTKISVVNCLGQTVFAEQIKEGKNDFNFINFSSGVYFIHFENNPTTLKFVKE